ncbi:MAG: toll/interleukin-1 receptor domain-containing protein, partial [Coprobacillus sp.]|nr:toll/interleukin-1 receptor domain-containing protein [Coprobacillus sp.]
MENIKQNQDRCPICGSPHFIKIDSNEYQCENCGFLKVHNEELSEEKILVINAYSILRQGNYVDAEEAFDDILNKYKNNYEALWGKICSHHGIVFVEDNNKIYPTFHDIVDINFLEEEGFKRFLSICPEKLKEVYINLAKRIEDLRDKYYKQVLKEKPYDIFISFKASDEKGNNTKDYIEATNLHSFLVEKGYKVFFSPVSLKDKTASEYEPYIYHALRTAKVMIVYGQKEEYFEAKWLKNEWGRFIRMIDEGIKEDGSLIVCYENMNPNN